VSVRVVVCLDKFRGSVTAVEACAAVAEGLRAGRPDVDLLEIPVADGGEGTVDVLVRAGYERRSVGVDGPLGRPVTADYAVRGSRAVIEMAQASGQHLTDGKRDALRASTFGTGQLMLAALATGCTELVLSAGGSATTDGGAGMLQALGARLRSSDAREIGRGGGALSDLELIELDELHRRFAGITVTVASDVDNPLLGPRGAAAVFAPQKGAAPPQVTLLERALDRFADRLEAATGRAARDRPGAGAAGGLGFGAFAALDAGHVSGTDFVIEELDIEASIAGAQLVVVGEGHLDEQSLAGKAPVGIARLARRHRVPVVAVAGQVSVTAVQLADAGIGSHFELLARSADVESAIANARSLLTSVGVDIAHQLGPRERT
jgi:glycerate kinase